MNDTEWFASTLRDWFLQNGRKLPWRDQPSPYEVWVSELMLQQTQVVTVLPYYARWLERFPSVQALASADISEVLQLWAGLGYYRRARFLHEGAKLIVDRYGGTFPDDPEELKKIRGIGSYTAGAIAAFAFHKDTPAIDGYVERVISRFFGIDGDLSRGEPLKLLHQTAHKVAAHGHAADTNQAMMDLGASCCAKIARCAACPLAERCFALKHGLTEALPTPKAAPAKTDEYRACLLLRQDDGRCLIARRRSELLLGGLWEFPMITICKNSTNAVSECRLPRHLLWKNALADIPNHWNTSNIQITHVFTHIKMTVILDTAQCATFEPLLNLQNATYDSFNSVSLKDIPSQYAISTLMKKIIKAAQRIDMQKTLPL